MAAFYTTSLVRMKASISNDNNYYIPFALSEIIMDSMQSSQRIFKRYFFVIPN
ncbi:MAG: hypothetical protein N2319_00890 [Candidatus Kapabacteria bacterium]|nr:hypothetical protein [Candidatus Kapabacteria bacterium]